MKRIALSLSTLCFSVIFATAAERPNVLIFLVDDMGLMDTSVPFLADADGKPETHPLNRHYRTPAMEQLARTGIRFETFYANSVCSPSRVSIFTGQDAARHHTTQWIKPTGNNHGPQGPEDWRWNGLSEMGRTLPIMFHEAGYRTLHAGKSHLGPIGSKAEDPANIGFDVNIGGGAMGRPESYYAEDHFGSKEGPKLHAVPGLEKYHGEDIYLTEVLTKEMSAAIEDAVEDGKPFFAHMSYYVLHAPFQPNRKYLDHYAGADMSAKAKAFSTMVESMDVSVGQIMQHLDDLGVAEDTLVLFLGDNGSDAPLGSVHGIASSAPLRGKKGTHYEGGMRVPFIATWAKQNRANRFQKRLPIAAGTLSREMADITDIAPTLLAAAGIEPDTDFDGDDISGALAGGTLERKPEFLMHFPHSHRSSYFTSYREGEWKLIYHYTRPKNERCELFHLATDRAEQNNLAAEKPKIRKRMIAAMAAELEEAGAQYPRADKDLDKPLLPVVQ